MPASQIRHRPAKSWHKIVIEADSRMTDAIAAYLAGLSGSGIEISSPEEDLINNKEATVSLEKITAYLQIDPTESGKKEVFKKIKEIKQFLAKLPLLFTGCSSPEFTTEIIMEEDWGKAWKSFFTSFQITPKITIKPSWEEISEQTRADSEENIVIEMDPGLAFGTGHHASTQLALLLLEELLQDNKGKLENILDVGTGSGILAMGCARFGVQTVLAIDNDPDAVETAKGNIIRNQLEHKVTVNNQDIRSLQPASFELIVANIIHDTLTEMAPILTGLLAPKGYLVLSGILAGDQENSIQNIYLKHGMTFIKSLVKDEWAALEFQKD